MADAIGIKVQSAERERKNAIDNWQTKLQVIANNHPYKHYQQG